jgi:hypothetical protein
MSTRKDAMQTVMAALDKEADDGNIKEGAYIRLAGVLKTAHKTTSGTPKRYVLKYLLEQAADFPESLSMVSGPYWRSTRRVHFLERLIQAKKRDRTTAIPVTWWDGLMEGLIDENIFDNGDDHCSGRHDIFRIIQLCGSHEGWDDATKALERRLNKIAPKPREVFPLRSHRIERRLEGWREELAETGGAEIGSGAMPDVWAMLNNSPSFIGWLLKPNREGTGFDHGFTEEEVERLREYAFFWGMDRGNGLPTLWMGMLGLRSNLHADVCLRHMQRGVPFAEVFEKTKNLTYDGLVSFSMPDRGEPRFPPERTSDDEDSEVAFSDGELQVEWRFVMGETRPALPEPYASGDSSDPESGSDDGELQ